MSIDLSEFHDVFFDECFEGLNVMESGLLNLDQGTDIEEINSIFRAAHSIKGGSATFGFMEISGFTHVMETLLDQMRDGRREVTRDSVDLLLESVDVLRGMVNAVRDTADIDQSRSGEVQQKLENMLAGQPPPGVTPASDTDETARPEEVMAGADAGHARAATRGDVHGENRAGNGWRIHFRPRADILQSGNEPALIFRELQGLGELRIAADTSALPGLEEIRHEICYLGWTLTLNGDIRREEIKELFSWVADESELDISSLDDPAGHAAVPGPVEVTPDPAPPAGTLPPVASAVPAASAVPPLSTKGGGDKKGGAGNRESGSIRVAIHKVDELINMVGELVITQSMLSQASSELVSGKTGAVGKLLDGISQLERNTRELQESILQIRMLPISFSFSRFPRLVRDLSGKMGKQVGLKMTGEQTEVDKTVLEKIADPLIHLVRNSLDHGIEMPAVRKAAGKPESGTLELCAYHEGGDIVINVIDDGAGLERDRILNKAIEKGLVGEHEELTDEQVNNLIFAPGFSTAEQVSDVSGRGVGLDVVRRNVRDLGGNVTIVSSQGMGSTVTIRLPLTLAILDGQLARVGSETYIVPLVPIVESLQMQAGQIKRITGQSELYRLREEYIPIIRLNELFGMKSGKTDLLSGLLMVVEADDRRVGLFVDDLMGQQQVVIKSLETNFRQIRGISGATILGDGTVALIIDVPGLIQRYFGDSVRRQLNQVAAA